MTTEQQEEAGPVTVQIGVCSVCHALFLMSGDRLTSPCHGADPLAVLATLTIGADGEVDGVWGSHLPQPLISREEAIQHFMDLGHTREWAEDHLGPEPPAPAPAPPEEPPAEDAGALRSEEEIDTLEVLLEGIKGYLSDAGVTGDDVHTWLTRMGAEPEIASTAVGRLEAVREVIDTLMLPREPAPVAAAPSEAESSPEVS